MRKVLFILLALFISMPCYARSNRNHLIKSSVELAKAVGSPFYGALVTGPKNIKETWQYEVNERENEEDQGKLKYKLFSIWRAPGDETKGIIDGCISTVKHAGQSLKELISIVFSD